MAFGSHALLALATLALLHSSPFFNLHSSNNNNHLQNRIEPDSSRPAAAHRLSAVGFAHAQNDGGGDQSGM